MPFDMLYVINLDTRTDRRREILSELAGLGVEETDPKVRFFSAVKPDDQGAFPSIGARGCFLSHLGVLKDAKNSGHGTILILEDDANIMVDGAVEFAEVMQDFYSDTWEIGYLGHRVSQMPPAEASVSERWRLLPPATPVQTTHAMMISSRIFDDLVSYFEAMLARPAGDPAGGPMHVDGAYSWFRRDNPDVQTYVARTQYVGQRASKSDIAPDSWIEKLPFVPFLRRIKNRFL